MDYVIVEFPEEKKNGIVPLFLITSLWLIDNDRFCLWPEYFKSVNARNNAILNHDPCDISRKYTKVEVAILYRSSIHQTAKSRLSALEDCASSSSSQETKRQCKPNKKYVEEFISSGSDEDIPRPPTIRPAVMKKQPSKIQTQTVYEECATSSYSLGTQIREECTQCLTQKNIIQEVLKNQLAMTQKLDELIRLFRKSIAPVEASMPTSEIKKYFTLAEIIKFNDDLESNEVFVQLTQTLQIVGGKDVKATTKNLLNHLIAHEVAIQINWTGFNNKFKFLNMKNVLKLILATVRKNNYCQNATQDEVEQEIKRWFRNAADREGGRQKRAQIKNIL